MATVRREYVDKLLAALDHPEPMTRVRAAWLLGRVDDPRRDQIAASLIGALDRHCEDPEFLATAAHTLGALGHPDAIPVLARLAVNSFLKARVAAVEALARWASEPAAEEALQRAARDPNRVVRDAAARVFREHDTRCASAPESEA